MKIVESVSKAAKEHDLVVGQLLFILENLPDGLKLWIFRIKITRLFQNHFDSCFYGFNRCRRWSLSRIVSLFPCQFVNVTIKYVLEEGYKAVQTTRCLASDCCHHELDIYVPVYPAKYLCLNLKQIVMELLLCRGEFNDDSFRFPYREVANISPAGSVDYSSECMQRFEVSNELHTLS